MILLVLLALVSWAFVSVSLWLNPPLRDKPAPGPGKSVTILGEPVEITTLEQFTVTILNPCTCRAWFLNPGPCTCPPPPPFTPTMDIYATVMLEGLLLRGIFG